MRSLFFLLLRLTAVPFLLRQTIQRRRVSILCYHDPRPDDFARHLRTLSRLYNFISLRDYLDWRRDPRITLPPRPLVLTFDDGHRNNYALRSLLQRIGAPATIFLCSGIVGTRRHFWWTEVGADDISKLKQVQDAERQALLRDLGVEETREHGERQVLSKAEIRELQSTVDFQSHTRFHPILPQCGAARAADEIRNSKNDLEQHFGLRIYAFAYPNGDYCARDVALVHEAGYECALTIDGGYNTRVTDPLRLRRIPMSDTAGTHELIVKASGLWGAWERLVRRTNRRLPANTGGPGSEHVGANI